MPHRQTKQTGRRLSPLREYREVNRLRSGLERSFTFRLIRLFSDIANSTADSIDAGGISAAQGMYPNILRSVDSVIRQLYAETIQVFSDRAIANRRRAKAVATYEDLFETYIRTQGAQRVRDISLTTQRILQDVIAANSTAGVPVISQAIRERFEPRFSRARATTIARTEIHNASAYATHEQQKSFDAPNMKKQWMANLDGRTRASHAAVSGQQIGMDEDFIVAGKKMAYPGDPRGGPAEVINCRCVLMYIEDEDDILDGPEPSVAFEPVKIRRRPVRVGIDEIQIIAKAKAIGLMEERFEKAQSMFIERDLESATASKFRARSSANYGKAKAGTLSKEATSITNALLQETDELADIIGVVPLRGLVGIRGSNALANMGDAVIGVKGKSFNDDADKIIKGKDKDKNIADINERIDELTKEKTDLIIDADKKFGGLDAAFPKYILTRDGKSGGLNQEDFDLYLATRNRTAEIDDDLYQLRRERTGIEGVPANGWKWEDDLSKRPFTADEYFSDPLDKLRTTIYHEFGHNVHQQYLVANRLDYFNPVVEKWMRDNAKKGVRKSSTKYGDKNDKEWFAENFCLYFMDREDLVDPLFIRLIEAIINKRELPDV